MRLVIMDALSTMFQLLGRELEEASWLIKVWFKMEPIKLCNEEW